MTVTLSLANPSQGLVVGDANADTNTTAMSVYTINNDDIAPFGRDKPRKTYILDVGLYDKPGQEVTAGTPASLPPFAEELPRNRLGLARWLVAPENPLSSRVTVSDKR